MMSSKRKRLIETVENSPPVGTPAPKKRKGRISVKEKEKITEEIRKAQGVFDVLRQHKDSDNRPVVEHFIRTPSRRADPEYYKQVKSPIDLTRIQQKLKTEEYRSFDEFCEDVELLVENSKSYYKEDSVEHRDAVELLEIYKEAKEKIKKGEPLNEDNEDDNISSGSASPSPSSSEARSISPGRVSRASSVASDTVDTMMLEDILCGILELTDGTGRLISPPFRVLQSREEFPLYYEKIKDPMDLKTIAEKTRSGRYQQMREVEVDIRLLCKNAQQFSGKGSEIYRDAYALMQFFKEKRDQVLEKGVHPKRREKVHRVVDALLSQSAALIGDAHSEDSEEDEDTEDNEDPRWQLYWAIRNATNDKDRETNLADPFLELPSRSYYPDYYDEIARPISLFMINKKLKRNDYQSFDQLFRDFMQVYENACEYNLDSSDIYIAAKKLEELTIKKARELDPSVNISGYEKRLKATVQTQPKTSKSMKTFAKTDMDSDSEEKETPPPKEKKPRSPRKMRPISTGMSAEHISQPGRPGRKSMDELMLRYRQKLMMFWDMVNNYKEGSDYWPAGAFMELPSAREYPDYYQIITQPMDLKMIRDKIENNKYESSVQVIEEMQLVFANARRYNEPGSQITRDATRLEDVVISAHSSTKDAPFESPLYLKQKFGWLKTKLPQKEKRIRHSNGSAVPTSFNLANGYSYGFSDDDSSNSSIRSPAPIRVEKVKTAKVDKKMEDMISRLPEEQQRMWRLFNGVKEYRDDDGRRLSTAFLKLPTREEYPDYYEVIKKPMDLQRIQQRLNGQGYPSWSELVSDMGLMLDNACKYNEPDSTIYKDAVSLQRVLLEKKRVLGASDETMPRVQVEIRTMFTNIFVAVFSKKDSEGRCRSDSLADLPDLLKARSIPRDEWPFSFDQIKRNIDKCRYRRLDRFQKDFFELFERSRELSKVDSKMFEDAVELQCTFISERDAQCKNVLVSNAYNYNEKNLWEDVEKQKKMKHALDAEIERRESNDQEIEKQDGEVDINEITVNGVQYSVPSYVYISRTDDNSRGAPHIMRAERIFKNENGDVMVRGKWVYRPNETLHLVNRKFVENEVFITPFIDTVIADRLSGRCMVISLKTLLNNDIEGMDVKNLYVCESRYFGKPRYFVKIKTWPFPDEEKSLSLIPRSRPISPVRVASEFVNTDCMERDDDEKSQSRSSSSSEEDDRLRDSVILDVDRPEVRARGDVDADGRIYLLQMRTQSGKHYAVGEFVLVFNPHKPVCDVMRIDKLWRERDNSEWFSGGWLARPSDIIHDPGRMFYSREVFAVNQPDQTRRVDDIQTRCTVLLPKEYIKQRPTEVPECDVFVCECRVQGSPLAKGEMSSLFIKPVETKSSEDENVDPQSTDVPMHIDCARPFRRLRQYKGGALIADEELFLFKSPITMEKEMSSLLKSEVAVPLDPLDMDIIDENDTDGTESVASKPELSSWLAAQPKLTAKSKSGYILFSAEIRKRIMHENPEAGFGEVSKIVGIEWKKLSEEQKRQYEVRAEYIASERAKQDAAKAAQEKTLQPGQLRIYQCRWSACDSQFDSENGLFEHIVQHHTSQIIMDSENQYVCMWVTCVRNRKDGKPFPSLPRLHRHMKEKHLTSSVRNVYPNQLGRNFFKLVSTHSSGEVSSSLVHCPYGRGAAMGTTSGVPQSQQAAHVNGNHSTTHLNGEHHYGSPVPQTGPQNTYSATPSSSHYQPAASSTPQVAPIADAGRTVVRMQPGAEPVFVAPPSSVHARRVLHSETYLRYIESLSSNRQRAVSKWETSLTASARNTQTNPTRPMPAHWIKDARGRATVREDEVVRALWKLRDQLLESTCNVSSEKEYIGLL